LHEELCWTLNVETRIQLLTGLFFFHNEKTHSNRQVELTDLQYNKEIKENFSCKCSNFLEYYSNII
jgi:hypothetical protein